MENKGFLNTFIAVLAATLFFYGLSTFGALAFGQVTTKVFGDRTYVGPYDISGYKGQEALEELTADFTELEAVFSVDLAYQDAIIALPEELVRLDAGQTIERAESGAENPIVATVSVDGLRTVLTQQFAPIEFTEDSLRSIASGIEQGLGKGIMPLTVYLTDYMESSQAIATEIASSALAVQNPSDGLRQLIRALDGTKIDAFSSFSLLDIIQDMEADAVSDEELTILASVLYASILQTNFEVDERNIGNCLSTAVEPGFEAAINTSLGLNFIFTNPNKSAFTLHITFADNLIQSSLTGMPLLYQYEPYVEQLKTYKPKTVPQFSAFVPVGQIRVEDEGEDGMEVSVRRLITNEGVELNDEAISSDFYAPKPRIELHALKKEEQQNSNNINEEIENAEENEPSSESNKSNGSAETSESDTLDETEDVPEKQNDNGSSNEVQYDKGGNIIN